MPLNEAEASYLRALAAAKKALREIRYRKLAKTDLKDNGKILMVKNGVLVAEYHDDVQQAILAERNLTFLKSKK